MFLINLALWWDGVHIVKTLHVFNNKEESERIYTSIIQEVSPDPARYVNDLLEYEHDPEESLSEIDMDSATPGKAFAFYHNVIAGNRWQYTDDTVIIELIEVTPDNLLHYEF